MSALSIQVPFPVFQDRDGQPLDNGYVWIGEPNLNPQTNPVVAYYDEALTIIAAQPLRTINGYVSRSGTPAQIYVDGVNFSILVQDNKGSMIYSFAEGTGISADASGITYNPPFTGSVPTNVEAKLAQTVSVQDFNAVGDGITNDTIAIQAAINAAIGQNKTLVIDGGIFLASALSISNSIQIEGAGTLKQINLTAANFITISGTSTKVTFTGITFDGNEQNQAVPAVNRTFLITAIGTAADPAYFKFFNCVFLNGAQADVSVYNDSTRTTNEELIISGCSFLGGREGISAPDDPRYVDIRSPINYTITENIFDLLQTPIAFGRAGVISYDGFAFASTDAARGVVNSNVFVNCGRNEPNSTLGAIDIYNYARTMTVANNSLSKIVGRGIQVKSDAENITISGNTLEDSSGVDAQITVNRSVSAIVNGEVNIVGNTCLNSNGDGISISGGSISASVYGTNYNISNNIVKNAGRRGIGVIGTKNTLISNNIIDGADTGVYCESLQTTLLAANNTIGNIVGNGLFISPTSIANVSIVDNRFDICGSRGIYVGAATGGLISSNNINATTQSGIEILAVTDLLRIANNVITSTSPFFNGAGNTGIIKVENNQFKTALSSTAHTVTIASGVINTYLDWHSIDTEGGAASDDVDTITASYDGAVVVLRAFSNVRDVVLKDGTGNLILAGDFTMDNAQDSIMLKYMSGNWIELCRSNNGA